MSVSPCQSLTANLGPVNPLGTVCSAARLSAEARVRETVRSQVVRTVPFVAGSGNARMAPLACGPTREPVAGMLGAADGLGETHHRHPLCLMASKARGSFGRVSRAGLGALHGKVSALESDDCSEEENCKSPSLSWSGVGY